MKHESLLLLLRWLFAGLAVAAIVAYVIRPLLRILRRKPDVEMNIPDYGNLIDDQELEIPTGEAPAFDREKTIREARSDPHATALLLRKWLKEKS